MYFCVLNIIFVYNMKENFMIVIIGLGYVGLFFVVVFVEKYLVIGFDINEKRIFELKVGKDKILEVLDKDL